MAKRLKEHQFDESKKERKGKTTKKFRDNEKLKSKKNEKWHNK